MYLHSFEWCRLFLSVSVLIAMLTSFTLMGNRLCENFPVELIMRFCVSLLRVSIDRYEKDASEALLTDDYDLEDDEAVAAKLTALIKQHDLHKDYGGKITLDSVKESITSRVVSGLRLLSSSKFFRTNRTQKPPKYALRAECVRRGGSTKKPKNWTVRTRPSLCCCTCMDID